MLLLQTENQPMYMKQLDSCWSHANKAAVGAEASASSSLPWAQLLCKAAIADTFIVQCAPASWFLHAPERPETTLAVQKLCVSGLGTTA